MPRGRDIKKAARGEATYVPEWIFPSPKRGTHLVEPRAALDLGESVSGMHITMHDLRRGFAGEIAVDAMVDDEGRVKGDLGLVKIAMNHADAKSGVTQGYITNKPHLKMLRPIYLAHEKRVLTAAGLQEFLPQEKSQSKDEAFLADLLKKAKDDPNLLEKLKAVVKN
jgi:hypothetical protein